MVDINRVTVAWGGSAVVGGGVNQFYFAAPATDYVTAVKAFYTAIKGFFPQQVQWTVPNSGDTIDATTGDIVGAWTDGTSGSIAGDLANPVYAAGVGARIVWNTAGRTNNRRVRGSTFLLPIASNQYAIDGTLDPGVVSTFQTAGTALITAQSGDFVIWSRPNDVRAGSVNSVQTASLPDRVSWLRSRRT